MPIFQDDLENQDRRSVPTLPARPIPIEEPCLNIRLLSEESLPTELCEGPVSDGPRHPYTPKLDDDVATSCRAELIERLKRGQSPTWKLNRHLESIFQRCDGSSVLRTSPESPQLLPEKANKRTQSPVEDRLRDASEIERPRSALHSGDFTNSQQDQQQPFAIRDGERAGSQLASETPWLATSPPRDFASFRYDNNVPFLGDTGSFRSVTASSPLSSSFSSSSFAYYPPTSPLVQSESNDEVDFAMGVRGIDLSSREFNRRLHALNSMTSASCASPSPRPAAAAAAAAAGSRLSMRRRGREPYQAHQPRRSLTSTPSFALSGTSLHQSPAMFRTRRPSLGSDSSPIQHASMVGSYEESILRGRMSTNPSKPFDFLAQIGVLGLGKCKSSLRCPAHVTLPFPAVYYSYNSTSHSRSASSNDGPSPYVGQIDLENGLPDLEEESRSKRKAHGRYMGRKSMNNHDVANDDNNNNHDDDEGGGDNIPMADSSVYDCPRPASRPKRRMGSPRAPPGGSYRIPERGQIQIVIKNQNKTAVKLFLMPYDLAGMEPGTKTFIRQRSYSAGPIIDNVPNPSETDAQSRPMLRYLVHLHICCPSKGRFYLYKSIRVVFANRVPEGKEKLQNETTWPEPRFTPYKPIRVMHPPLSASSGPGAMLALDKAFRRRSLGVSFAAASSSSRAFDMVDGLDPAVAVGVAVGAGNTLPIDPIPFRLPCQDAPRESDDGDSVGLWSPDSFQATTAASRPPTRGSPGMAISGGISSSSYEKLNKGDVGYGGHAFSTHFPAAPNGLGGAEGLLSQRLRSLGVNKPAPPPSAEDFA
ncbi:hypothetical protein E4U43_006107 [Claviceps pusilla]|uniref:Atos-like conserved domain-containing protein n=1 Tax=Claviceps pusilla TaxID=123648 RepID=A0A9P7T1B2_9HYPO|nr:hypothetical protein E4U43_006107 [Claviceps pusilla]